MMAQKQRWLGLVALAVSCGGGGPPPRNFGMPTTPTASQMSAVMNTASTLNTSIQANATAPTANSGMSLAGLPNVAQQGVQIEGSALTVESDELRIRQVFLRDL